MEPELRGWAATYTTQLKKKRKAYHDGALILYPDSGRLVLLDDAGATIDSMFLQASETVSDGAPLEFPCHLVDVGEPQRHSACYSGASSATAASRTAYRGHGLARERQSAANTRAPRTFLNPPKSDGGKAEASGTGGADAVGLSFQEWSAMYTTQLTQKAKKYHDGFLRLVQVNSLAKQIVLLNEDGEVLGSRYLKSGECVENGKKCNFPNYLIEIGEAKNQNKGVQSNSSEEPKVETRPKSAENTSNKKEIGATSSLKFISPQKFHYLDESKSEVTSSSNKLELGKIEHAAAGSTGSLLGSTDLSFQEWCVLYTTQRTQKAKKYHDGVIRLMQVGSHTKQIVLLDEEGGVLGSRYLKSGETVETGTKCQFPNYLIEVGELRNQKNDVEPKLASGEALSHTGSKNGENTTAKTGDGSKSPKFVSPLKFHDLQKSKSESTSGSNRPQVGKLMCSNVGDPLNFHAFVDLQRGKPDCSVSYRRTELGKSTFSNMDNQHKFNDFADIQGGKPDCTFSYRRTGPGKLTISNMDDPHKFDDIQRGKPDCTVSYRRTDLGKSTFSNMDDPHNFNDSADIQRDGSESATSYNRPYVGKSNPDRMSDPLEFYDLQDGKSVCSTGLTRREVGKSTFGNMDDPLRTASQILSIMKPPAGLSHFATQLRTSVQSCLKLDAMHGKNSVSTQQRNESSGNVYPTYDHQAIMKPAALDSLELAMVDIPASEMSNANDQKLDSLSNHHTAKSNGSAPIMSVTTIPGLQKDKNANADQLGAGNTAVDPKCGSGSFLAPSIWTCKDPKIQDLIDDCPSFDLGF